ncbi:MAG: sigma-70 family RNA polymerase sigma factor [Isosphaeraceae bacterium]
MSQGFDETSPSLLERAKGDDPEAWQRLVRIYGPLVYGWARKAGLQPSDASDVVQEVFVSVARGLGRFRKVDAGDSFKGWLWTVCRNKIRDHARRAEEAAAAGGTTAHLMIQGLPESPAGEGSEEGHAESQLVRLNALLEYRNAFESQVWDAFWRVAVEQRAPADVARELGVSVWAVYKARSRVVQRLRRELDGLVVPEAS